MILVSGLVRILSKTSSDAVSGRSRPSGLRDGHPLSLAPGRAVMPTYSYACTACSNRFEVKRGFASAPEADCPECQAPGRKVIAAPAAIVFRGGGFYSTD